MTGDRVYWLQLGAGNAVIGSGAVQGAEAIAVTLGKPGRVEVSAEIAAQLRQGGAWVWNGSALEPAPAAMTEDDRARALWEADHMAEAARRPFLSAGAGQAMEYLLTLDEAQRFIGYAGPASDYPLLAAEQSALQAAGQTVPLATVAAERGIPLYVGEGNSASCGGSGGVSDVFASALWAVDVLFHAAGEG